MQEVLLSTDKTPWCGGEPAALGGGGISTRHVALPAEGYEYAWQGEAHYLALHDIRLRDGELLTDTLSPDRARELRGTMTFMPAQSRVWGWGIPASPHNSFTALYFDPSDMDEDIARRFRETALTPQVHFSNPTLFATLSKLRTVLCGSNDVDRAYLESLLILCAFEVCQFLRQQNDSPASLPGRLSLLQQRRLSDYVEAHLASDIGLEELAHVVGLSRFHLIRTFKITTGMTPYQYLVSRRIERARDLLRDGRLTTEAVARKVGFKSPSHFIRRFRQMNGTTPRNYADAIGASPRPGRR